MPDKKRRSRRYKKKMATYMLLASKARDMMSLSQSMKTGLALYSGASDTDDFHKQIGLTFDGNGEAFSVYSNSGLVGANGNFQGPTARRIYDFVIKGEMFSSYQVVPGSTFIPAVQRTFNWALVLLKNGWNISECVDNLSPPIFTPSLTAGAKPITVERTEDGNIEYSTGEPIVNVAASIQPSALKRKIFDDEVEQSEAKRLRPLPTSVDVEGSIEAQPIVSEIYLPRSTVIASGTGACIFNNTTVKNAKFKAYHPGVIDMKVDDAIVFVAKSADSSQIVSCLAQICFKVQT